MKKLALIFTSLFIILLPLFSQENFLPGYAINNNGDTLKGYIDYRKWEINPQFIYYKSNLENLGDKFSPNQIRKFSVNNEIFESATVKTVINPDKINNVETNTKLLLKTDTVFLQSVIIGDKSLFYYINNEEKEHFYIKQDSIFNLLIYNKYKITRDGKDLIGENKNFTGQLLLYLNDCQYIKDKLASATYTKKSLQNIFKYYYNCTNKTTSYQKNKETTTFDFGFLAGSSITKLNLKGSSSPVLTNIEYSLSVNLLAGLFCDITLPMYHQKWSFNNELIYTSYKVKGRFNDYINENNYTIHNVEFGYSYLKLNTMFRFKYPIHNYFLYLNFGITNGYAVVEKNTNRKISNYYTIITDTEVKALADSRKYEQGLLIGVGIKYQSFSLESRYERGNGMSEYSRLNSTVNRFHLILGYAF
jgi:hypothetical protein